MHAVLTTFADGRLFGMRHGDGAARVLALHGWARDHTDWTAVLGGLEAVALDLPGFGATPAPPTSWGSARYASEVAPTISDLAPPVVVVGHSFGGRVALHLASAFPDLVGALVLSGVPNLAPRSDDGSPAPALAYRAVRWLHQRGVIGDERMEAERRRRGSADYRAARGVMRDVLVTAVNEHYDDLAGQLSCPVELIWGAADTAAPLSHAEWAADHIPGARLTVLDGVGHLTPTDAPEALRSAIDRRLAALPAVAGP